MRIPQQFFSWVIAIATALVFGVIDFATWPSINGRWYFLIGLIASVTIITVVCGRAIVQAHEPKLRRQLVSVPGFFVLASALFMIIADTSTARYGILALTPTLLLIYFYNVSKMVAPPSHAQVTDVLFMAYALIVLAFFFLLVFLFGVVSFFSVPIFGMIFIAGAGGAFLTNSAFWQAGMSLRRHSLLVLGFALLGAEFYAVLSLLPTGALVNALTMVVIFVSGLRICQYILMGQGHDRAIRRQIMTTLIFLMLILSTAQWI